MASEIGSNGERRGAPLKITINRIENRVISSASTQDSSPDTRRNSTSSSSSATSQHSEDSPRIPQQRMSGMPPTARLSGMPPSLAAINQMRNIQQPQQSTERRKPFGSELRERFKLLTQTRAVSSPSSTPSTPSTRIQPSSSSHPQQSSSQSSSISSPSKRKQKLYPVKVLEVPRKRVKETVHNPSPSINANGNIESWYDSERHSLVINLATIPKTEPRLDVDPERVLVLNLSDIELEECVFDGEDTTAKTTKRTNVIQTTNNKTMKNVRTDLQWKASSAEKSEEIKKKIEAVKANYGERHERMSQTKPLSSSSTHSTVTPPSSLINVAHGALLGSDRVRSASSSTILPTVEVRKMEDPTRDPIVFSNNLFDAFTRKKT